MTVEELLALLHDLPVEALKKPIFVGTFDDVRIVPITRSCEDLTILAYIVIPTESEQLEFDFSKDVN